MEIFVPKFNTFEKINTIKLEEYAKYAKIAKWGRRNPVGFTELILGAALIDFQKYMIDCSWGTPYVLWLLTRGGSKTTTGGLFIMDNMMLINNYPIFISTNSIRQSIVTFKKIEDIAKRNIPSFRTLTDIFYDEMQQRKNGADKFNHSPDEHSFSMFNGSSVKTLSSNFNANRGERGSVFFDETAWQNKEQVDTIEKFASTDTSFSLGVGENLYIPPQQMPYQLVYSSSAGDVNYPFYERYVKFSKKMFMGDTDYFVCDLTAYDIIDNTTVNGKKIASHLKRSDVEEALKQDRELAEREYLNQFTSGAGKNALVDMETLIKCSYPYKPIFRTEGEDKTYILTYDPARMTDNSILSVFELIKDEKLGYKLKLVNTISFVDIHSKNKTPMDYPKQVVALRRLFRKYNGEGTLQWSNIDIYIDAGAGGGGISGIADPLSYSFVDNRDGYKYRPLIDVEHKSKESRLLECSDYSDKIHYIEPKANKHKMYSILQEYLKQGLIEFPDYDSGDILLLIDKNGKYNEYILSEEEKISLQQSAMTKRELLYIERYDDGKTVSFNLQKEKRNTMHDDRAYTVALAAYALSKYRKKDIEGMARELEEKNFNPHFCVSSISF